MVAFLNKTGRAQDGTYSLGGAPVPQLAADTGTSCGGGVRQIVLQGAQSVDLLVDSKTGLRVSLTSSEFSQAELAEFLSTTTITNTIDAAP